MRYYANGRLNVSAVEPIISVLAKSDENSKYTSDSKAHLIFGNKLKFDFMTLAIILL